MRTNVQAEEILEESDSLRTDSDMRDYRTIASGTNAYVSLGSTNINNKTIGSSAPARSSLEDTEQIIEDYLHEGSEYQDGNSPLSHKKVKNSEIKLIIIDEKTTTYNDSHPGSPKTPYLNLVKPGQNNSSKFSSSERKILRIE